MSAPLDYEIVCSSCHKSSSSLLEFKCNACGKPLQVKLKHDFDTERIHETTHGLWRYREFFPYVKEKHIITLGEGWTPLVKFAKKVYFKLDNLNPTGSFKDRGSSVLISALHESIKRSRGFISEDSSGNAGASVAAYSARAGLRAKIYVPKAVSGPKFNQTRFYGAEVVKVSGSRSRVAEAAQTVEKGKFYVGHILHPLFRDGIRSLAYEIAEQSGWRVPERVYLPASAGTLLLGVVEGFRHLVESDILEAMPKIVACQTQQVSPLYHRLKNLSYTPPDKITSIADALVSVNPPLLDLMITRLKEIKGDSVLVEEDQIIEAFMELAGKGFFVEPSSAVAHAGYKRHLSEGKLAEDDEAVIVLTGMGLKTTLEPFASK